MYETTINFYLSRNLISDITDRSIRNDITMVITQIKQLKRLKIMDLQLVPSPPETSNFIYIGINEFRFLTSLTHLSFHIYNVKIGEMAIEKFSKYLPKLQYLDLRVDELTDSMLCYLWTHPNLAKVRIVSNHKNLKRFIRKVHQIRPKLRISGFNHKNSPNVFIEWLTVTRNHY